MTEKEKLVDRDLHLFEAINEGKGEHLEGSESVSNTHLTLPTTPYV